MFIEVAEFSDRAEVIINLEHVQTDVVVNVLFTWHGRDASRRVTSTCHAAASTEEEEEKEKEGG